MPTSIQASAIEEFETYVSTELLDAADKLFNQQKAKRVNFRSELEKQLAGKPSSISAPWYVIEYGTPEPSPFGTMNGHSKQMMVTVLYAASFANSSGTAKSMRQINSEAIDLLDSFRLLIRNHRFTYFFVPDEAMVETHDNTVENQALASSHITIKVFTLKCMIVWGHTG